MRLKVKIFGSTSTLSRSFSGEDTVSDVIERQINTWLLKNKNIDVVEIKQSTAGGGVFASTKLLLSVWYHDSKKEQSSP